MANKRVLILTSDAGFGHRRATEAIRTALAELYEERCETFVVNPFDLADVPKLIRELEAGYDDAVTERPALYQFYYDTLDAPLISDLMRTVATHMLDDVMQQCIRDTRPDVVVSTYPFHSEPAARAIENSGRDIPVAVVITDLAEVHSSWFSPTSKVHFAPTPFVRQQALDNGLEASRVRVTGLPVHPSFAAQDQDKSTLREVLGWREEMPVALIVASTRTQQMATIARLLDRAEINLQVAVICGGDEHLHAELQGEEWHGVVHVYGWVDDMPQMMKAADFIVCKAGGLIVSESLACGLPIILSEALQGQELGNVRYVVENGAGAWAPEPAQVLATAYSWLKGDPPNMEAVQSRARALGKPRAAYDIAEVVWDLAG
jgi:1,2-diacylglycerol 3-beta-galactosyltransferase